ncbi:sigma-54-dependent Fis family transcriptional regulator [bacterium]|nr:sigma-54-dependent Fis family transcriptional regulator [bacterium]
MFKLRVLVADDQLHFRQMLMTRLQAASNGVFIPIYTEAETAEESVLAAEQSLKDNRPFDLVIMDINFSQDEEGETKDGHWASNSIREILPDAMIVMISSMSEEDHREAIENSDVITRFFRKSSFSDHELFRVGVWASLKRLHREHRLVPEESAIFTLADSMKEYLSALDQVDPRSNIVIYGETGTGKELSAKRLSANAKFELRQNERPFVAVNCGGISPTLAESELFGHVKGAFTGAMSNKVGFLEAANGGDLFLDELQNAPLEFQKILMRAIQERSYIPVGSTIAKPFEVRIIVAMNQDPNEAVESGKVMPDFMARVRQSFLRVPALRERRDDIEALALQLLKKARVDKQFSAEALVWLCSEPWKENVRGLLAFCQQAVDSSKTPTVTAQALRTQHEAMNYLPRPLAIEEVSREATFRNCIHKILADGLSLEELLSHVEDLAFVEAQKIAGSKVPKRIAEVLRVSDRTVRRRLSN